MQSVWPIAQFYFWMCLSCCSIGGRAGALSAVICTLLQLFFTLARFLSHLNLAYSEITLSVQLKTPAFTVADSLSHYAERRVRTRDCTMRVRVCRPISIEIDKNPLFISHDTTICATIQNPASSTFPIAFARLSLVEGSARYLGPAGTSHTSVCGRSSLSLSLSLSASLFSICLA